MSDGVTDAFREIRRIEGGKQVGTERSNNMYKVILITKDNLKGEELTKVMGKNVDNYVSAIEDVLDGKKEKAVIALEVEE